MSGDARAHRVLVACLGNPDRGDDGVGALVAQQLENRLPEGVELYLRRGDMLALAEDCSGFGAMICVDAAAPMGEPGRIHRIGLEDEGLPRQLLTTSTHGFGVAEALALARTLGQAPGAIVIYAIEGLCFDAGAAMTPEVTAAAREAAALIATEAAVLKERSR